MDEPVVTMIRKDDTHDLNLIADVRLLIWQTGSRDIARRLDNGEITYRQAVSLLEARCLGC